MYIVPDKTPKESEKYRELPKELEERKDKGETDLMIRDMKVVKRRDGRQRVTDGKEVRQKSKPRKGSRGKSNIREKKLLPCACSPKRTEAITRQTNERNVNSKSDLENTQNYLLDCYCANAQTLNNKMDEFREVVSVWKPKIVGITESCSKDKSEGDTHLEHRDDRGRGVILYIYNKLQSTPCVELNSTYFESCVWNIITLNKKDKLLVGCIYISTSSTEYLHKSTH